MNTQKLVSFGSSQRY